jgi:hypothetical protein
MPIVTSMCMRVEKDRKREVCMPIPYAFTCFGLAASCLGSSICLCAFASFDSGACFLASPLACLEPESEAAFWSSGTLRCFFLSVPLPGEDSLEDDRDELEDEDEDDEPDEDDELEELDEPFRGLRDRFRLSLPMFSPDFRHKLRPRLFIFIRFI